MWGAGPSLEGPAPADRAQRHVGAPRLAGAEENDDGFGRAGAGILPCHRCRAGELAARSGRGRIIPTRLEIEFGAYLRELCADAAGTLGPENGVTVTCTVAETLLPTATAVRLGLIAKELVTNALEHVFSSGRTGVTFTAESGAWHLTVEGSGTGLPAAASSRRVGLRLGRNLSRETGGRLQTTGLVGGTRCSVVGPQPRAER